MDKKKAGKIYSVLLKKYPKATTALKHVDPLQLLVATLLSAQWTDARVNIVTKDLFKKYKSAKDYAKAKQAIFEKEIRSTGFYKNKAKNIIGASKLIVNDFKGKVPSHMEDLIKLPGVARKTANIVLFHGYGKSEGIAVDTHVKRLSYMIGLTDNKDVDKQEQDLMQCFSKKDWGNINSLLVSHGRKVCIARKPQCNKCVIEKYCDKRGVWILVKEHYNLVTHTWQNDIIMLYF